MVLSKDSWHLLSASMFMSRLPLETRHLIGKHRHFGAAGVDVSVQSFGERLVGAGRAELGSLRRSELSVSVATFCAPSQRRDREQEGTHRARRGCDRGHND